MRYLLISLLAVSFSAFAAPPKLGPDCGPGATTTDPTTISGSSKAGKITLGERPDFGYDGGCTIALDGYSKAPSCSAVLESNGDPQYPMDPYPLGVVSTNKSLWISAIKPGSYGTDWDTGYVISYLCVGQ